MFSRPVYSDDRRVRAVYAANNQWQVQTWSNEQPSRTHCGWEDIGPRVERHDAVARVKSYGK